MAITEEEVIETNEDFLLTESTIKKNVSLSDLTEFMKKRKTTTSITTRILQGGIASICVAQKTKISKKQRDSIRHILGMQ